jgi:hypothetical protein
MVEKKLKEKFIEKMSPSEILMNEIEPIIHQSETKQDWVMPDHVKDFEKLTKEDEMDYSGAFESDVPNLSGAHTPSLNIQHDESDDLEAAKTVTENYKETQAKLTDLNWDGGYDSEEEMLASIAQRMKKEKKK